MKKYKVDSGMPLDKRFYLTGVVVEDSCPTCGEMMSLDLGDDYISYPETGKPIDHQIWCGECDKKGIDSYKPIKITIQIYAEVE